MLVLTALGILVAAMPAHSALADRDPGTGGESAVATAPAPVEAVATSLAPETSEHPSRRRGAKTPRLLESNGWWPGMAALALAAVGGIAAVARRFVPRPTTGTVNVVGRVSLSPKHSVYLLRVGRRVLLVGTGPQGPPSLIAELDEVPENPPDRRQEDES